MRYSVQVDRWINGVYTQSESERTYMLDVALQLMQAEANLDKGKGFIQATLMKVPTNGE